jgi:hypothetical protein
MASLKDKYIAEVKNLIQLGIQLRDYGYRTDGDTADDKISEFTYWRVKSGELISKLYNANSSYLSTFNNFMRIMHAYQLHMGSATNLSELIGVLNAIEHDLENGLLEKVTHLVAADIFSNFLEMAEHLLDEGYKDAATVMIGSVLEEHLRQLCHNHGIDTHYISKGDSMPKKANLINDDLRKEGVYGPIEQKQVLAWLGIRNSAAHGRYSDYTPEQVN